MEEKEKEYVGLKTILVILGLISGNLLTSYFVPHNLGIALERSLFQLIAVWSMWTFVIRK